MAAPKTIKLLLPILYFLRDVKLFLNLINHHVNLAYLHRVGFASTWLTFTALEQSGAGHHLSKRLHYKENITIN